jgi:hypothetical protein
MDLTAHLRQPGGNEIGGLEFLEAKLRVLMDVSPPSRQLCMEVGDAIDDRHGKAPGGRVILGIRKRAHDGVLRDPVKCRAGAIDLASENQPEMAIFKGHGLSSPAKWGGLQ